MPARKLGIWRLGISASIVMLASRPSVRTRSTRAIALVAAADHHEDDRGTSVAQPLAASSNVSSALGEPIRAGVIPCARRPAPPRHAGDIPRAAAQAHRHSSSVFVGHDVQLAQVRCAQPCGVPSAASTRPRRRRGRHRRPSAHRDAEGWRGDAAAQLDRRQRPESCTSKPASRRPAGPVAVPQMSHRIGARGDHHVGAEVGGDARRRARQTTGSEGPDVRGPAQAVA